MFFLYLQLFDLPEKEWYNIQGGIMNKLHNNIELAIADAQLKTGVLFFICDEQNQLEAYNLAIQTCKKFKLSFVETGNLGIKFQNSELKFLS
jgi:hypothetical protein